MGVLSALIASLLLSSKDIVSKKLSVSVDGTTSAFASFFFALPLYIILLTVLWFLGYESFAIGSSFFFYVLARSISDSINETCKMHALSRGEFSVILSIIALHPALMLITAPLITKEPVTSRMIVGVIVTVCGSITILFKRSKETKLSGIFFALLCAIFMGINTSFDRLSVQSASPAFSAFSMTALAALFLAPSVLSAQRRALLGTNTSAFFLRGGFEVIFMLFKLYALQFLSAPSVSAILRLSLIISVISGNVIFKEVHFARKMAGAILTVIGVVLLLT